MTKGKKRNLRTNKTMNGPGLTNKLLELAGEDPTKNDFSGTSAWDAKDYVGKYLNQVNNLKSWTYAWKLFKIDAKSTIDDGFPVALYGNLKKPDNSGKIDHAVVAYSYDSDGHFTVHFGWAGYSKVSTAGGIIGSTFLMYMS